MNELFVNIKVDREERPDLDSIYMQAVQALTGQGGWPMTVFLTPEGVPFFGGTYYPPEDRQGMPSFTRSAAVGRRCVRKRRDAVASTSAQLRQIYDSAKGRAQSQGPLTPHTLDLAYRALAQHYDIRHGGFDGAPKFPPTDVARFSAALLEAHRNELRTRDGDGIVPQNVAGRALRSGWAAAFTATPSTRSGSCRTSRRCSTTTPFSCGLERTSGRRPAMRKRAASPPRRSPGLAAR